MAILKVIQAFFNDMGWLANAFGIILPIATFMALCWGAIKLFGKKGRIDSLYSRGFSTSWTNEKAKRIVRIAVVDDQPRDFPISELKSSGFEIEVFKQVKLSDITLVSSFDVVFLDMKGIVKDDPDYGGLKLIEKLRDLNKKQRICAVSGQTFDPTATRFFKLADEYKKKPLTAHECKDVIDRFARELFDPTKAIEEARGILRALKRSVRVDVVASMQKYIGAGKARDVETLRKEMLSCGVSESDGAVLLNLARMICS
ncbi:response regulator [Burkholderia anthina]|uniref:response regulator n=1 Tax=Burkholderia anthina TaxID=179879 RepID=UPI000F5AD34A|nr:response regulator [Burkholderia anthina]